MTVPYNPRDDWDREDKEARQAREAIAEADRRRKERLRVVFADGVAADRDSFEENSMDKVTSYRTGHRAGMDDGEYDSTRIGATVENLEKHEVRLRGETRTDAYLNGYRDGYQLWIR